MPSKKPKKQKSASVKKREKKSTPYKVEPSGSKPIELRTPKGMHDVLPHEMPYWDKIYETARSLAEYYQFAPIRTPILEFANLFLRPLGESSDVVQKEMYLLKTKGGELLALRPENTASTMRAYLEHHLGRSAQPVKLFYWGPMFRHEHPQAGRFREFTQAGFEIIGGTVDSLYDAQIILISSHLLRELKFKNIVTKVNSIGCRVCRPPYKKQLQYYYRSHLKEICEDCLRRLEENPLRLLDCKKENCAPIKEGAPSFYDKLCSACSGYFRGALEYLDEFKIPYELDATLVRGFDYYNRTVFEMFDSAEGKDLGALAAGGRYDYLAEALGSHPVPATGAAVGIERLIAAMKAKQIEVKEKDRKRVFVIHAGDRAKKRAVLLIEELRDAGIYAAEALGKGSLASQLKSADRARAPLALILGQKEMYEGSVIIRDLRSSLQETIPMAKMIPEIKKRLNQKT